MPRPPLRSLPQRAAALLPEGRPLPQAVWERRHRAMAGVLVLQTLGLTGIGLLTGMDWVQVAALVSPLVLAAAISWASDLPRRMRTVVVALGLVGCSAVLVQITDGLTESHFHFFVMLALITLFQEWLPLLAGMAFVALHHSVVLRLEPAGFVQHATDPGVWAGVHGLYVLAAGGVGMLAWRLNERERNRSERVLNSTAEGIYGVDADGIITFANDAMARIIGAAPQDLIGVTPHDACGHSDVHGHPLAPEGCRVCGILAEADGVPYTDTSFRRADRTVIPVEVTATAVVERGRRTGTVVSFRDLTEHAELTERALRDMLTGLPNRALFMDHLQKGLTRLERSKDMAAMMFIDLDRFKVVNDSLGHAAGDALLIAAAERLKKAVRTQDTVARFGGDEFVVLCETLHEERDVVTVAERIIEAFSKPFSIQDSEISATASVGITVTRDAQVDPSVLVRDADAAMYRAKESGRGRYEVFDSGMRTRAITRLQTESNLWRAIARDELVVHYQPKVDLRDGSLFGVEALVRWEHPDKGLVGPDEFIPIAEETGLIVPIGAWVLEEACRHAQVWRARRPELARLVLAVNLSAKQLTQPNLPTVVAKILERTGTPPHLLCLEVTETVLMEDVHVSIAAMQELSDLGVMIAVDDFGTGYSSLSYLSKFPVDILKIDRSFIAELGPNAESWPIVAAVIGLAKALGLTTVAEGVEADVQIDALRALGCEIAQGFRFARPQAGTILDALITEGRPWVEAFDTQLGMTQLEGQPVTA